MRRAIGYMLTWTTYGSWLQGDLRGYAKDGQLLAANRELHHANQQLVKQQAISLDAKQRQIVCDALLNEASTLEQKIYAFGIGHHHIHLIVSCGNTLAVRAIAHYKVAATHVLKANGFSGKVWTHGYSKRFCFDEKQIRAVIEYVRSHHDAKIFIE